MDVSTIVENMAGSLCEIRIYILMDLVFLVILKG